MSSTISVADITSWFVTQIAVHEHLDPSEIDVRTPFSSYGLGSMDAIRLSGDLEQWLGRRLSPTVIYDYPSIELLAHYLVSGTSFHDEGAAIGAHQQAMAEPVAIIGLGCRFPGAAHPEAFWHLLSHGQDAIREIPVERWDAHAFDHLGLKASETLQVSRGGFLDQVDLFDPHFFGISPREAISMDPQQRVLLEVAWETLENAGQAPEHLAGSQTGVFLGISNNDYGRLQSNLPDSIDLYDATGNALSIAANRLSYFFGFHGPSLAIDTACSSSLVAVHLACQSLRTGEATLALAGGVNMILSPDLTVTFTHSQMVASDGHCKTFDASADGYVRSEGCGFVALKVLSNALEDGDQILATIRGSAMNQDGRSNGLTAPNGPAQQAVIRQALHNAQVTPDQIGYVEAHGSGTPLGDPIEMQALEAVLAERKREDGLCLVGSVKTNIGHLEAAAGIAGFIKTVLALHHQQIPAHLHLKEVNPRIHFSKNCMAIPTEVSAWPKDDRRRRFAGVSSFGLGGTNAHVILEEAPERVLPLADEDRPLHLFTLAAKSDHALRELAERHEQSLATRTGQRIQDICFTTNAGRSHFAHRFVATVASREHLQERLQTFVAQETDDGAQSGVVSAGDQPRIAFLYPGQGSQYVGMGYHLSSTQPTFRRALTRCAELLRDALDVPLFSLLHPRTATPFLLEQPRYHHPLLFAVEYALTQLWKSWGVEPDAVLGHGPGEYAAACSAGVLSLADGLRLVVERGKLLQAREQQEEMEPIVAAFDQVACSIRYLAPAKPMISSVTGQQIEAGGIADALSWHRPLSEPTGFSEGVYALGDLGCQIFIEVGPQSYLPALGKDCVSTACGTWLPSLMAGQDDWQCLLNSVGALYVQGIPIDWAAFDQDYTRYRISLPTYPFERQRYWKIAPVEIARDTEGNGLPALPEELPVGKKEDPSFIEGGHRLSDMPEQPVLPVEPSRYEVILSMLTTMVSKSLQRDPTKIDSRALLLEMGANSLVLLEVMQTIEKNFGVKLEILDFFDELANLEALAAYIEQKSSWNVESIDPLPSSSLPAQIQQTIAPQTVLEEGQSEQPESSSINEVKSKSNTVMPESALEKAVPVTVLEQIMTRQLEVMSQQLEVLQRTSEDVAFLTREVKEMRAAGFRSDPPPSPSPGSGRPQEHTTSEEEHCGTDGPVEYSCTILSQGKENIPEEQESIVTVPLLEVQKQFWVLAQVGDGFSACYERMLELRGPLDVSALHQAFQQVIHRHGALRTSISADGDVQYIHQHVSFSLPVIDFSQIPAAEHSQKVEQWLSQEHQRGFDLTQAPLLRAHILKLAEHTHILALSVHHIVVDGQSFYVFLQEMIAFYSALVSNTSCQLPPAVLFRDYLQSQIQHSQSAQGVANEAYWVEQFADILPVLELPIDHTRPLVKTYNGARQSIVIEAEMLARLKKRSEEQKSTLFMLLFTTYAVMVHMITGQDDVIIGIPFVGHMLGGDEHLIGSSADVIPIRSCVTDNLTFVEVLTTLKRKLLEGYEHQPYMLASLIQHLKQSGDRSRTPVVSTTFNQNRAIIMVAMGKLEIKLLAAPIWHIVDEISINVVENNRMLEVDFDYNTDLFEEQTIHQLLRTFRALLEGVVMHPEQRLADMPLLTPAEQRQLLLEWNATQRTYPQELCVHEIFEQQAQRTPDAIAIVDERTSLTYRELNSQSNQLAHHLQMRGVGPEMLVGVYMERSVDVVIALLALFKTGGVYVPLDPSYPAERLTWICEDAALVLILTKASSAQTLPVSFVPFLCVDVERHQWGNNSNHNLTNPGTGTNLAYVIYTSGSTGRPKGAMIEQRGLLNHLYVNIDEVGLTSTDRMAQTAALCFDISVWQLLTTLLVGGCTVIYDQDVVSQPATLIKCVQMDQITILELVPTFIQALLDIVALGSQEVQRLSSLRWLIPTGEALSPQLCRRWFTSYPAIPLLNAYGPTECSDDVAFYQLHQSPALTELYVPIGRSVHNMRLYVLDQHQRLLPSGMAGELYISGIGVGRGYLNNLTRTAESFIPDPFVDEPGQRMYKTGDRVRSLGDGTLEFLGRVDQQVKLRGFRIELGEIEATLQAHPSVQEAVVLLREEEARDRRLVAYVILQPGETLSSKELRATMQLRLPIYMHPSAFVFLEALPLTPNGKVDRNRLPSPEECEAGEQPIQQEARTPLEELLLRLWCEVLGRQQIGMHENFFELRGHSLMATQLVARVRDVFNVEVSVQVVFEEPTVAGFAYRVEQMLREGNDLKEAPLIARERPEVLPLSFEQQRLWFLDQLEPGNIGYLLSGSLPIHRGINTYIMEQAFEKLIDRHESLRTTFEERDGQPMQVIHPAGLYKLPVIDLQGLGYELAKTHAVRLACLEVQCPCDLAKGPLMRISLLRLEKEEHALLLTLHHIITDGWSNDILIYELTQLYQAMLVGQLSPLAPLPMQYVDYALWQREWLQGEVLETQLAYWRTQLADLSALELPTDHPRPPVQTYQGSSLSFLLSPILSEQLVTLSQQQNVTLFMFLLATFQVLMARYSGQNDISIGTPIANRRHAELEGVVGFFVNTLILRTDLSGNPTFEEVLQRVRKVCLEAYVYQALPFEKLVEELAPQRDISRSPLFQVMLGLQNTPQGQVDQTQFSIGSIEERNEVSKFDLSLSLLETEQGISGTLTYSTNLFETETIARLLGHWQTVLEGVVHDPHMPFCLVPLLTQQEQDFLLTQWNMTRTMYPQELCVHHFFEQTVQRTPEAVALVFEEQHISYAQLNLRANQLASYLRKQGVGSEVAVGLCMERSIELVIGLLAILKVGGIYVPLDPGYPQERLAFLLQDAQVALLLLRDSSTSSLPTSTTLIVSVDSQWHQLAQEPTHNLVSESHSDNLAYMIYTSGSTGHPKGVMISHRAIGNRLLWGQSMVQLTARDRTLQVASSSFDISFWEILAPLQVGACLVLAKPEGYQDSAYLLTLLEQEQITIAHVVPTILQILLDAQGLTRCHHLRWVLYGGEASSANLPERFFAQSQAHLQQFYGPTEASINATSWEGDPQMASHKARLGHPIANMQLYLLDSEEQPVPIGIVGEIYLGGLGLARGYFNRGALTAERFIPHLWSTEPGERLYRTGDLARYLPDGALEFLGRRDQQVKLRGYRIELGEIEAVLRAHPGIQEAVMLLQDDVPGSERLVAYIVGQPGEGLSEAEMLTFLHNRLPAPMLPAAWVFLETLPLTPNGKINRQALPTPDEATYDERDRQSEARTPIEELLLGLWCEMLGRQQIGIQDNFFELGGHSLLATHLLGRVETVLGVEVPLRVLFEAPTIAEFAQRVEHALHQGAVSPFPLLMTKERPDELPLSFAQQRLWFLNQLEPESMAYIATNVLRISSKIDVHSLNQAMEELTHRHESLRTTFVERDGQPIQVIHPAASYVLPLIDLHGLGYLVAGTHADRLAHQEAQLPCDLAKGPLVRTMLLRQDREEHILLLTMHHIITDGWSSSILVQELSTLYEAIVAGRPSPLASLPIQYADYALWQREWLQGEVLEAQLAYWRTQLAGVPPLELPIDHPRSLVQMHRGNRLAFQVSALLLEQLAALGRRQNVTLFMLLLTTFQVLLARYSGQSDISVGTPIANRRQAELEGVVGFFLNTLVLHTDLSGDPTFEQLLQRVREVCLGAYAYQDIPFEKVVEELAPQRDLSRSPLFQVLLILQNTPSGELELGEGSIKYLVEETFASHCDLTLSLSETEQGLLGTLEYDTDLFEEETIIRLLTHWQILLEGIVQTPQAHVFALPMLTEGERELLLVEWNATQKAYPEDLCVHELFEQQVQRIPDALSVACEEAGLTYRDLNRQANQLARYLQQRGVCAETRVGVYMEPSLEVVIALLAIFKAGGVYIPLAPSTPAERLALIVQDAQFQLLLTHERVASTFPMTRIPLFCVDTERSQWGNERDTNLASQITEKYLAYVIYTSGSTGIPKGAMIEQQGMRNHLFTKIEDLTLTSADRVAQTASLSFDISVWQLLSGLLVGGCTVIYSRDVVSDPPHFLKCMQMDQISIVETVPSFLQALLGSGTQGSQTGELPHLRWLVSTGEALSPALCCHWFAAYPQIPLLNAYGPTECSDDVTSYALIHAPDPQLVQVPIGRLVGNIQGYVLDPHQMVRPLGIAGELFIGGVGVGRGYLNDPQRTAAVFVPDPFAQKPGQRLYKTGDRARYLADGALEFLGRRDQQVKLRGYRIELEEIEAALRAHPGVQEAVMLLREEATGEQRLVAYVVGHPEETLSGKELRGFIQDVLPAYMLPSAFVVLDMMPLTSNGKVNRKGLPAPEDLQGEEGKVDRDAHNPLEELLGKLWREVLGHQVGVHDNFFEVGGHSLLATQLLARVRAVFVVEVPLRTLFEAPTIAEFAQRVEHVLRQGNGIPMPVLVREERPDVLPLSFAQQRLWFLDRLDPESTAYLMSNALRIKGKIDGCTLERALEAVIERHESLRTTFEEREDEQLIQVIRPASSCTLPVISLDGLDLQQREQEINRLISQEAHIPCDLTKGPLLRTYLLRRERHEHTLLLTLHHIITDGWSNAIFVRELITLYRVLKVGQPSPLVPLPIHYADYALWQREWLQGQVLQQHIEYWKQQLLRIQPLKLPVDASPSVLPGNHGASYPFTLSTELSEKLLRLSQQENVTLFMLLLAVFQVLLYRSTDQDDIVVGTDVANRNQIETENLIGFFVNQLVLRSHLTGQQTFREFLQQVRNMTMDAYLHQEIPFEKLVEVLRPKRKGKAQATPFFSVKMLLENVLTEKVAVREALDPLDIIVDAVTLSDEMTIDLDLILRLSHTPEGIEGTFEYRTDLFERVTIERMAHYFLTLVEHVSMNTDKRLDAFEKFREQNKEQSRMQRKERKVAEMSIQLKNIRPQVVQLHEEQLIRTGHLDEHPVLPLVISPQVAELTLSEWAQTHQSFLETELSRHGALLFRGFRIPTPADFERFAAVLCTDLFHENGEHIAVKEVGQGNLYTPVFYAPDKKLLWHNENSFNARWPMKIFFHCAQPAEQGGETPIADSREVFRLLDPALRKPFVEKGILYERTYIDGLGLSWQAIFRTTDRQEVEAHCRREGIAFEWKEGDRLTTRQVRPAVLKHPQTGEMVWWNQAPHWHPACLDPEVRTSLLSLFAPEDLPRNCFYGDGSPIDDAVMNTICDTYQKVEVSFPWQTGDILVLDNMLTAHARNPYKGTRKIYVSMGNMLTVQDLPQDAMPRN